MRRGAAKEKTARDGVACKKPEPRKVQNLNATGLRFAPVTPTPPTPSVEEKIEKPKRVKKQIKNDPRLVAAARELRDRWLEGVNAGADLGQVALPVAKYDVSRAIEAVPIRPLLEAA